MHKQISAELQVAGPAWQAEAQARAQSTWQRNKVAQAANTRSQGHGQATGALGGWGQATGTRGSSSRACACGHGTGRMQAEAHSTGYAEDEVDLEIHFQASTSDDDMIG
ncbi:hypothetical protein BT96DRAFT_988064 [Gymnopus androsaceus JB14]|uniref:Uncharacterized protein n=1 Tax=Gymnopus androsaceus JB14 TaxID=1447944 RepID=A0A6A4I212_9AGAR|nr:hypothetical protein BT96DRAFT_988064 [Gymnopus androsaceus JB14]